MKLQEFNNGDRCDVILDVHTRWNLTNDMLACVLEKREPIELFLSFLSTQAGISAFGNSLPSLSSEDWALMSGLDLILRPFKEVTVILSGNSYPLFALAVPSLLNMQKQLNSEDLLKEWDYEGPDRIIVLAKLHSCQKWVQTNSKARLDRMVYQDKFLFWVTYLDPRFRDGHIIGEALDHFEKEVAFCQIREEAYALAQLESDPIAGVTSPQPSTIETNDLTPTRPRRKKLRSTLFDSPSVAGGDSSDEEMHHGDKLKDSIRKELDYYVKPVVGRKSIDPQVWWRENGSEFPHLSRVARKWLGVCASSTASERVFSSCGLALSAKHTKLKGTTLEAQVKLKYNMPLCGMSIEEIANELI